MTAGSARLTCVYVFKLRRRLLQQGAGLWERVRIRCSIASPFSWLRLARRVSAVRAKLDRDRGQRSLRLAQEDAFQRSDAPGVEDGSRLFPEQPESSFVRPRLAVDPLGA